MSSLNAVHAESWTLAAVPFGFFDADRGYCAEVTVHSLSAVAFRVVMKPVSRESK